MATAKIMTLQSAAVADGTAVNSKDSALALIDEGNALEEQGRVTEAMARYDAAVQANPRCARAPSRAGRRFVRRRCSGSKPCPSAPHAQLACERPREQLALARGRPDRYRRQALAAQPQLERLSVSVCAPARSGIAIGVMTGWVSEVPPTCPAIE